MNLLTSLIVFDLILSWVDILHRRSLSMTIDVLELGNLFWGEGEMPSMQGSLQHCATELSTHIQWASEEEMFFSSTPSECLLQRTVHR